MMGGRVHVTPTTRRLLAHRRAVPGGAALWVFCACAATTHALSALTHGACARCRACGRVTHTRMLRALPCCAHI
jgi:hypothetical protein